MAHAEMHCTSSRSALLVIPAAQLRLNLALIRGPIAFIRGLFAQVR